MLRTAWPAAALIGSTGLAPIVLVCEHASRFIPPELDALGLSEDAQGSHVAWDIGALDVAKCLSTGLDAPLVVGEISRLVYDCNRPLEAPDCTPSRSEVFDIPGNVDLNDIDKQSRFDTVHAPFHATVDYAIDRQIARVDAPVLLVTVHSFTPVFHGQRRTLDIGYLHDNNSRAATMAVNIERDRGTYRAAINEPYAARDGVTYTLAKHGEARGLDNVMIEIRNDLIDTPATAEAMADHLVTTLSQVAAHISTPETVKT
ncbi:Predicted N-formylglutamate amidohydrolase [Aliiroseovarius sediminilitoris]|uniref:Predicted N-formylglutamate amidohydrolase n=1 Tax=Aliiroseovarius sediminilitoris TaxID=1173584 RepID=A0A1I0QXB7_9RHOB|nr:N-formylglutamate amidohydrolase [Aliiroseovarius sediminilitoris]SEW31986.1 Predicted N-formylglutamate amidohydrolase [Aliiroseovarius sediminilitoris]